jgi:hypothetical protein
VRNETSIVRLPAGGGRNYQVQLAMLFEELNRKLKPGVISDAWILHDTWCAAHHGHPCNCNLRMEISVVRE